MLILGFCVFGIAAQAEVVWLSELDLSRMSCSFGQAQADRSIEQKQLTIASQVFQKGVGTCADSILCVNLNGGSSRFSANVGIDDETGGKGSACFKVYGDGKPLYNSGMVKAGERAKPVDVSTRGISKLVLAVSSAAGGSEMDHADWADAYFEVTGVRPQSAEAPAESKEIRTARPGAAPQLNHPAVLGARPSKPFIYRIPATGARPMRFSADGLPGSMRLDPENGILTGSSPEQRGEYKLTLTAQNSSGTAQRPFTLIVGDKLALTPPMGWNSWYIHYNRVTDGDVRTAADVMIASGMADYGYLYVNLDDCWSKKQGDEPYRDSCGNILTNEKFPDMKALTDYIHSKGLRAGLYTSPGPWTCGKYAGSYGYEQLDAQQFARWGFDFLKYDSCSYHRSKQYLLDKSRYEYMKPYALMGEILKNLDRDIVYNLCQYGMDSVWEWGAAVQGQSWRTMGDVGFMSFLDAGLRNSQYAAYAGPGHWNDPDYILIGWVGDARKMGEGAPVNLTPNQQYQYMSMWSLMAAPLFFSGDMARMDDFTLNVLCNPEVIAVNQDILGRQAGIPIQTEDYFVMIKPLSDGSAAIGIFNKAPVELAIEVTWKQLDLKGRQSVRDLWRQRELGLHKTGYTMTLPAHGVEMLRLTKN
ncbi:MAG: NPCBM/NEW2 domain-containing protein [Planctomycetaceae bacterium]|nr:NPCBM/NEW2 domain-containing protein [Planctomycetaceae bacterium]